MFAQISTPPRNPWCSRASVRIKNHWERRYEMQSSPVTWDLFEVCTSSPLPPTQAQWHLTTLVQLGSSPKAPPDSRSHGLSLRKAHVREKCCMTIVVGNTEGTAGTPELRRCAGCKVTNVCKQDFWEGPCSWML